MVPLTEYKKDRPYEYERLKRSGELRKRVVTRTITKRQDLIVRIFGYTFLAVGVGLIFIIICSVLFGYH